jgi:hypothetical protein
MSLDLDAHAASKANAATAATVRPIIDFLPR